MSKPPVSQKIRGYGNRTPGRHNYGDGLVLRVSPKGLSTWTLRLRVNGKWTMRKLGRAGPMMNAEAARRKAGELIEQAKAGELTRRSERVGSSSLSRAALGGMLTTWADTMLEQGHWSNRHHSKTLERMEKHLEPLWKRRADELTRVEINEHLATVESVDTAGRLFAWIKECLEDAADRGQLDRCVLGRKPKSFSVPKKKRRTRASYGADLDKLRGLYRGVRNSDHARSVRLAGQLTLLTGLRLGEVIEMRGEYYRADEATLVIPRERMKEKDTWRGDFTVPLAAAARAVVEQALETAVDGWLLPGPRTGRPVRHEGIEKMFQKLTDRQHTPHGTRTSLRTWALEQGNPVIVCDSLIDHATSTGSGEHYDQTRFIAQRRAILEQWAEALTGG